VVEASSVEGFSVCLAASPQQTSHKRQSGASASPPCIGGCGSQETTVHIFLECNVFGSLWHHIYQWAGISFISPESVLDHLHHFGQLAGVPLLSHTFLKVIWHATAWVIWKERNNRIFNNKIHDLEHLLESVKLMLS